MRALAPEPDERFQTMQALQIALESFARDVGRRAVDGGAGGVSSGAVRRRAGGVARGAARRQVAGRPPGGEAGRRRVGGSRRAHRDRRVRDARRRARAGRHARCAPAALAGFFALCAVAGALATKHWAAPTARAPNAARRARRKKSAVGGAGRGKESGNRTDRGKNSAVYDGDSSRRDEPRPTTTTATTRRHDDGDTKREDESQGEAGRDPPGAQRPPAGPTSAVRGQRPIRAWAHGIPTPPFRHNAANVLRRASYRSRDRGRLIAGDVRCLLPMCGQRPTSRAKLAGAAAARASWNDENAQRIPLAGGGGGGAAAGEGKGARAGRGVGPSGRSGTEAVAAARRSAALRRCGRSPHPAAATSPRSSAAPSTSTAGACGRPRAPSSCWRHRSGGATGARSPGSNAATARRAWSSSTVSTSRVTPLPLTLPAVAADDRVFWAGQQRIHHRSRAAHAASRRDLERVTTHISQIAAHRRRFARERLAYNRARRCSY